MTDRNERTGRAVSRILLPRRDVLGVGLSGFASVMMARFLPGCGGETATDGGVDAGFPLDAAPTLDAGISVFPVRVIPERPALVSRIGDIGPLGAADANGVRLPAGFTSRVVCVSGQMVAGSDYRWHLSPDGGATFLTEDGGWIYACNAELPLIGGAGALRFDAAGEVIGAYPILADTSGNCAGGRTPWHTWLSCEENNRGMVHECDPWGEVTAVARPAMGLFRHEAVTFDPNNRQFYLTEDVDDGALYRFTPDGVDGDGRPNLTAGLLEVAEVATGGAVTWREVPDPGYTGSTALRAQVATATRFDGGEGIWFHDGVVYFATKGDTRIYALDVADPSLSILYDGEAIVDAPLRGVDNVTVSCCGDVLVAEDGGSMQIVAIRPTGELLPLLQVMGHNSSEIAGPAFDPSGTRLYFSSQRGSDGNGITFEVSGPFHEPA